MVLRALFMLAGIAVLAAVAAWLAQSPGDVSIAWRGWRIDTSAALLMSAAAALAVAVALIYRFWRALVHVPAALAEARRERRRGHGYRALARGMVAVAAGDPAEARRQARQAEAQLDQPPLTLLLSAQAAQLEGREAAAAEYFSAMLERPETEFLGLRGLLMQAERAGDRPRALALARRAQRLKPRAKWVLSAVFEKEATAGNWRAAEQALDAAAKRAAMAPGDVRRARAAVLLQQAFEAAALGEAGGDGKRALKLAAKAYEADPGFRPAAVDYAARLLAAGKTGRAARLAEAAWARAPHPELARVYGETVKGGDPLRRLQALERLVAARPEDLESHMALARAALEAALWGEARRHLAEIPDGPDGRTARFCRLMAAIEEAEHGNTERARHWLARAAEAPAEAGWVCGDCGAAAAGWHAICGHCGGFATMDWRTPPRAAPALPASDSTALEKLAPAAVDGKPAQG